MKKLFNKACEVAPLVGAWIEIITFTKIAVGAGVAPLVGAWIEMGIYPPGARGRTSLPLWERGLK